MSFDEKIIAWPKATGVCDELPQKITRPCDYGLQLAVMELETQLGTIEAYNRLVEQAKILFNLIKAGKAKPQNPLYAKNIKG